MATNKSTNTRGEKLCKLSAILLSSFLITFIFASIFTPVESSGAITCSSGVTPSGDVCDTAGQSLNINVSNPYYINVTSSAGAASGISLVYDGGSGDSDHTLGNVISSLDTVSTFSNTGTTKYLYMSTTSDSNNLTNSDTDLDNAKTYIAPGGGNTLSDATNLSDNTWGFNLTGDNNYTQVPTLGNEILIQEEIGTKNEDTGEYESSQPVYYGTLATTSLNSGTYSNTILYTAFTDEPVIITTYMQDFTNEMCDSLTTDSPIYLKDKRDDKTYSVTKLRDGNCWMTSNLALDGTDSSGAVRTLTPDDSNVSENRTLAVNISGTVEAKYDEIQINSSVAENTTTDCGSYEYCVVSNVKYGNLYNWNAATAGVGIQATTGTVFESICPKGWRLPDNGGEGANHSWGNLMKKSGYSDTAVTNGDYIIAVQGAPLYMPLAGDSTGSSLYTQGRRARFWSRTAYSSDTNLAYSLHLNAESGYFNPQDYSHAKSNGFSVRCVAR